MPEALEQMVIDRLREIADPCSVATGEPLDLVEMGLVEAVSASEDGTVQIRLRLTTPTCNMLGFMAEEANRLVKDLPGVSEVKVISDQGLDWSPSMISAEAQERRRQRIEVLRARRPQRAGRTSPSEALLH